MSEGSSEGELEGRIFDNVGVDFAWHAADLHGEIFGAAYCPVGSAISAFHLNAVSRVDVGTDFFSEVLTDDNDLQPGVEDPVLGAAAAD